MVSKSTKTSILLSSLTHACRIKNDKLKVRLPIQKGVIVTNAVTNQKTTEWSTLLINHVPMCLLNVSYYGLLCIGEIANSPHVVKARDVHLGRNKRKLMLILRSSKTHGHGDHPQVIKISHQARNLQARVNFLECPYHLTRQFIAMRKTYFRATDEPFFIFRDRSRLKTSQVSTMLNSLLKGIRLNHNLYSFHSLRSGRACDLLKMSVSLESVKKIRRWKSNAVFSYLKTQ